MLILRFGNADTHKRRTYGLAVSFGYANTIHVYYKFNYWIRESITYDNLTGHGEPQFEV